MVDIYYIDNDNMIELTGVRSAANGIYLNSASVTLTIVDASTGTAIAGQTWPATMSYVNASNGNYRLTLEYDLVVTENQSLMAKVIANAGSGLRLSLRLPIVAVYRSGP